MPTRARPEQALVGRAGLFLIRVSAFRIGRRLCGRELGIRPPRAFQLSCNVLRLHPCSLAF
jgi:hypothetical protein